MPSYVDQQIAAAQKRIADAVSGKNLRKAIKQLQDKSRVRDSLKDLPARGAITAKRRIGKRTGAAAAINAYSEVERTFHTTLRELRSTDGIFTLQWYSVETITMQDTSGVTVAFNYLDYDPDA